MHPETTEDKPWHEYVRDRGPARRGEGWGFTVEDVAAAQLWLDHQGISATFSGEMADGGRPMQIHPEVHVCGGSHRMLWAIYFGDMVIPITFRSSWEAYDFALRLGPPEAIQVNTYDRDTVSDGRGGTETHQNRKLAGHGKDISYFREAGSFHPDALARWNEMEKWVQDEDEIDNLLD